VLGKTEKSLLEAETTPPTKRVRTVSTPKAASSSATGSRREAARKPSVSQAASSSFKPSARASLASQSQLRSSPRKAGAAKLVEASGKLF
jgi:hypothetical protein